MAKVSVNTGMATVHISDTEEGSIYTKDGSTRYYIRTTINNCAIMVNLECGKYCDSSSTGWALADTPIVLENE